MAVKIGSELLEGHGLLKQGVAVLSPFLFRPSLLPRWRRRWWRYRVVGFHDDYLAPGAVSRGPVLIALNSNRIGVWYDRRRNNSGTEVE